MPSNGVRPVSTQTVEYPIALPSGGVVKMSGPFRLDPTDWDHLRLMLDTMRPGLVTDGLITAPQSYAGSYGA